MIVFLLKTSSFRDLVHHTIQIVTPKQEVLWHFLGKIFHLIYLIESLFVELNLRDEITLSMAL